MQLFERVMEDDKLDIYELKAKQSLLKNIKVTEDDCWIDESREQYVFRKGTNYIQQNATQAAYRISRFEGLTGKAIIHCCPTRNCCNPEHLIAVGRRSDMGFLKDKEFSSIQWAAIRVYMEQLQLACEQLRIPRHTNLIMRDAVERLLKTNHNGTNPIKLNSFLIKYKLTVPYVETSTEFQDKVNQFVNLYEYTPHMKFNDYCKEIIKLSCFLYNEKKFLNHCCENWAEFKKVVDNLP